MFEESSKVDMVNFDLEFLDTRSAKLKLGFQSLCYSLIGPSQEFYSFFILMDYDFGLC